jgi:hypothetical protein
MMNADNNHPDPATSRAKVIESIEREYGEVTFYDLTTVIAGGKKHQVPEGTTHFSGQIEARQAGSSTADAQCSLANQYEFSALGTEENVRRRREAIEALRLEYGEVNFFDSTTVIAGGKKHQVPEGTVFVSAQAEWKVGTRGGIYKRLYSPKSGRSYREYYS